MSESSTYRVRLRFAKQGDLRLVSHHDLLRCLERLLRRAELPMARTQGFHPHPRMAFPLALGLGIEGRREVLELELTEPLAPEVVQQRLAEVSPAGFDFIEAQSVPSGSAAQVAAVEYALDLPADRVPAAQAAVDALLASVQRLYTRVRPDRTREIDLRRYVRAAVIDPAGTLRFRLEFTPDGSARPEEIVETLDLRDLLQAGATLVRTDVVLRSGPSSSEGARPGPDETAAPRDLPDPTGPQPERQFA